MKFLRRLWFLFTHRQRADDLREEMRLHVELRAAANQRHGLDADHAERAARRRFGNELRLTEESADAWGFIRFDQARQDLRHAVRHLAQRPMWTATIVLTLAIGIGANASVFALVNAILFAPVAGAHPDRLVWLATRTLPSGRVSNMSYPDYTAFRDRSTTLTGAMAYSGNMFSIGSRPAARVYGDVVSGNYFDLLGVHAALGRPLRPDDDRPGSPAVAVLSDVLWKERFGGNFGVVNSAVGVNGHPFVIVGVAPPGFVGGELGEDAELWVPLARIALAFPNHKDLSLLTEPDSDWLRVIGRLRDGVTLSEARAELVGLAPSLRPPGSASKRRTSVEVTAAIGDGPSGRGAASVLGLLSLVPLLVLLVACSNVGNVIMANNVARRREFAMRRAVGASRGRLIHQLLVEAVVLALGAALAGLVASSGLTHLVGYLGDIPPGDLATVLGPNLRVLLATTTLALAAVVVFGLLPALTATKLDLVSALKEHGDRGTTGRFRLRSTFVVVQVALSAMLLVVAGLFLQSVGKSLRVDTGFEARGAVSVSFDPALQGYSPDRQALLVQRLLDRAGSLPGVTSAAITTMLPLSGETRWTQTLTDGDGGAIDALRASVSPKYFETMRSPLVAGRVFTDDDGSGAPLVAIVNQALARRLWPNQSPLGRRLRADRSSTAWLDVVGVVADGKYAELTESPQPALFLPIGQAPGTEMTLVARGMGETSTLARSLAAVAAAIDPDLPVYRVAPLDVTVRRIAGRQTAAASLLGVLGALTLLLAAIGLYGVAAHNASIRVREVGVRMALGAHAADVVRLFVGDGLRLAAIGVATGLVLSAAVSRLLSSFLFGLTATDATTFVAGAGVLCVVAAVASYVPARRAARLDPAAVLRQA
jgi:predicted permease